MRIESAINGIRGFISRRPRSTWLAVSAVILCFGALRLPTPVFGDQAGKKISRDINVTRLMLFICDCRNAV